MTMTDGNPDSSSGSGGPAANLAALRNRVGQATSMFDRRQRTTMGVVFVATIGAVLAFSFLGNQTDWKPLMTNLSADDAAAVTKQLDSLGTEYELADGGATVMVPADVVYQTRIDIAAVDMPSSGKVGYGILDSQDLTSSEFSQRVGYKRAMEGELAMTIESIEGVNAALVHLAIPKDDTFALDAQKATASVMVKTAKGTVLSGRQVQAIVNLVASGTENLSPDDVTVADGAGNVLAAPGTAPGAGGGDSSEMQGKYEATLASSIEEMLAAVVGPGKAKATVSAELDFDSSSSVSETYAPPTTLVAGQALAVNETTKNETYGGDATGTATQGVLGPTGTAVTAGGAANGSGYQLNERQVNNAVNKVVENVNRAPGTVKKVSVAVIVDEEAVTAAQLPEIQTLVSAAAGITADRGDTIAVSRFALDNTESKQLEKELAFRDKQLAAATGSAGIPVVAVAGAGGVLLVLFVIFFLRSRKKKRREDADVYPLELSAGNSLPAEQIINIDATPRRSPQDAGVFADVGAGAAMGAVNSGQGPGLERREVLGDLIDNQPDEVAQLLRSWLGDRREVAR